MIGKQTIFAVVFVLCSAVYANAAEWGHLKGRFVYDGAAPKASRLAITKDREICGKFKLLDESLVVHPDNRGVANVIVFLYLKRQEKPPAAHPSYAETAEAKIPFLNKNCRFSPRIVLLRTTQTLVIGNGDVVGHNTKVDCFANAPINPIIPAGTELEQQFTATERLPTPVSCSIHPWMTGFIVVRESPYFATSGDDGAFEIKNLPAGEWTFQAWHENAGYVREVTQGGKPVEWSKGRFKVTIEDGKTNDFGDLLLSPSLLQAR